MKTIMLLLAVVFFMVSIHHQGETSGNNISAMAIGYAEQTVAVESKKPAPLPNTEFKSTEKKELPGPTPKVNMAKKSKSSNNDTSSIAPLFKHAFL